MTDRASLKVDSPESTPAMGAGGRSHQVPGELGDFNDVPLVPREGFFEGMVAILGRTRVEGTIRGSLRGPGELVLGPEARVEGIVECDLVSSRGVIIGPVVARIGAHFGDGAHLEGDLDAPTVEVEGDVVWNGVARVGG